MQNTMTDDDLDLLLGIGSTPKTNVLGDISNFTQDEDALLLGSAAKKTSRRSQDLGKPLSSFRWAARRADREDIVESFQKQLAFELTANAALEAAFDPFMGKEPAPERKRQVIEFVPQTLPTLDSIALRSYQIEGVQFMLQCFHRGMSCILADDMGLGKTAQISSFLYALKTLHSVDGPHLIIVPLSSLTSWCRELHRWAPTLRVVKFHGDKKSRIHLTHSKENRHSVFLTTPATFTSESKYFKKFTWTTVVIDEAHCLRGGDTSINNNASKLEAICRIAVTGTPVQNSPQEVGNMMRVLYPKMCKRSPFDGTDPEAPAQCMALLQHIMLRRTKNSIELGLPPRIDEPITMIEPTPLQKKLLSHLKDTASSAAGWELGNVFMNARKVCNHPHTVTLLADAKYKHDTTCRTAKERLALAGVPLTEEALVHSSGKMMQLDCLLRQLHGKHRVLLFSNFTSQLDILEAFCVLRGYSFERLDGSCNRVERELSMIKFNAPESSVFIFLVTTTAGGVGITLTGADTVILYDAHYNPQIDRQAADRAHRIGQTRPVHIHRFCLQGTSEESVVAIANNKANLGDMIVDGKQSDEMKSNYFSHEQMRSVLSTNTSLDTTGDLEGWEQSLFGQVVSAFLNGNPDKLPGTGAPKGRKVVAETHHCFCCGGKMRPLEPLLHCSICPKAYHPDCVDALPGDAKKVTWCCPRHECAECSKKQSSDGALFLCSSCPSSFCFDCLDDRYLELEHVCGVTSFKHIHKSYPAMDIEQVTESRERYYITCLECLGMDSSSSEEDDDSSTEEWEDVEVVDVDA